MRIAVLGAGTYGSYVIDSILKKYPEAEIILLMLVTSVTRVNKK